MKDTPEFHWKNFINLAVIVVALGYFVDIFDLTLFAMLRTQSLISLGIPTEEQVEKGKCIKKGGPR